MRNAFFRTLAQAARRDDRIVFLTADLGFKIVDEFATLFPDRFFNVGVAEATMVGVASGMAQQGLKPFVYSIATFAVLRCYEQIRDDVCYHDADVTVVGVGGGYTYGVNGPTHQAMEDIAVTRVLPGMTVVCPGDAAETEAAVLALAAGRGPAYLRLGRAGDPKVHSAPVSLERGRSLLLREGTDVTLLSTGCILPVCVETAAWLENRGVSSRVVSMPFVKPLDLDAIREASRQTRLLVIFEEHSCLGGFGSAVCEFVAQHCCSTPLVQVAAADSFMHECGHQDHLRRLNGLTAESAGPRVLAALERPEAARRQSREEAG